MNEDCRYNKWNTTVFGALIYFIDKLMITKVY